MKLLRCKATTRAFTWVDLIIVLATVALFMALLPAFLPRHQSHRPGIRCVSNLRQIGLAFRIFANEHDERYPFAVPNVTNEHTGILLTSNVTTARAWMHFQALSNELQSAKVLMCREDTNRLSNAADDFLDSTPRSLSHREKRDLALSYFVGLAADETKAEAILAGDRNIYALRKGRVYSSEELGGAIHLDQGSAWSGAWPPAIHGLEGNVALADGSVQQMTTRKLQHQLESSP